MSPQHSCPVHNEQPAGAVTAGSPQTDPPPPPMVRSRMPCTPLRVCAPSPASQSGQHPHSLTLNVTVQVQSPHTPMVRSGMPCTPLRVCAPPHRFPIGANTLTAVKCNCAGSPHTPHGQPKDAVHSPVSVRTILWLPNRGQHPSFVDGRCHCVGSPNTPHGQLKDAVHSPASVRTILWLPNPGTVQAITTHSMVSSGMPCTPLRVCAPPHRFPIRANTLIHSH